MLAVLFNQDGTWAEVLSLHTSLKAAQVEASLRKGGCAVYDTLDPVEVGQKIPFSRWGIRVQGSGL